MNLKNLLANKTLGIEIETTRDNTDGLINVGGYGSARACDLPDLFPKYKEDRGHWTYEKAWGATYDSSIRSRGNRRGIEVVSPCMKGEEALESINEIVPVLRDNGFDVNQSCGLHVHVGLKSIVGNADADDVVAFLAELNKYVLNAQKGLYASTGTRRDAGQWCRPLNTRDNSLSIIRRADSKPKGTKTRSDFDEIADSSYRYKVLNLTRLRNGMRAGSATLEFRFMAGTLNRDKIFFHIASILFLIDLAWKQRHSGDQKLAKDTMMWEGCKSLDDERNTGVNAVKFLIRRMNRNKLGKQLKMSPTLNKYWERGQRIALRMAEKYDAR